MTTNQAGIDLIKHFEGVKLDAYQDSVGIWTIGFGSTGEDVLEGLQITPEEAEERLRDDLDRTEKGVSRVCKAPLTDNQFSALVCFAYNVGVGNLQSSTLLKLVNAGKFDEAALQFGRWSRAGGKVLAGLVARRAAEAALFSTV